MNWQSDNKTLWIKFYDKHLDSCLDKGLSFIDSDREASERANADLADAWSSAIDQARMEAKEKAK